MAPLDGDPDAALRELVEAVPVRPSTRRGIAKVAYSHTRTSGPLLDAARACIAKRFGADRARRLDAMTFNHMSTWTMPEVEVHADTSNVGESFVYIWPGDVAFEGGILTYEDGRTFNALWTWHTPPPLLDHWVTEVTSGVRRSVIVYRLNPLDDPAAEGADDGGRHTFSAPRKAAPVSMMHWRDMLHWTRPSAADWFAGQAFEFGAKVVDRLPDMAPLQSLPQQAMMALEVCCGCAKYTRSLRRAGLESMGIDCIRNRHKALAPVVVLDLTDETDLASFFELLATGRVVYIHWGIPCGTGSRAREIPLTAAQKRAGIRRPLPLRNAEWPWGMPHLEDANDVARVLAANRLYILCCLTCCWSSRMGILWTIENPARAWFWSLPTARLLKALPEVVDADHHACMHGGNRDKWQRWRGNFGTLLALAVRCDRKHQHAPWRSELDLNFGATRAEAEYPDLLCSRACRCTMKALEALHGLTMVAPNRGCREPDADLLARRRAAAAVGIQGRSLDRDITPVFKEETWIRVQDPAEMDFTLRWKGALKEPHVLAFWRLPIGARRLEVRRVKGGKGGTDPGTAGSPLDLDAAVDTLDFKDEVLDVRIGLPWSVSEFVAQARATAHPFLDEATVPEYIARVIFNQLTVGVDGVEAHRDEFIGYVEGLVDGLESEEAHLHGQLDEDEQFIIEGKKVLAFKRVLEDLEYPDPEAADLLVTGIGLIGEMPGTGVFPPKRKTATCDMKTLLRSSKWAQKAVTGLKAWGGDRKINNEVTKATLEEASPVGGEGRRKLRGPLTPQQLTERHGPYWIASRRRGVEQKDKLRLVDDFSEFLVNSCVGTCEKVDLRGVDGMAAVVKLMTSAVRPDRSVRICLASGEVLEGWLHPSWNLEDLKMLGGRTLDLEDSYKQFFPKRAHRFLSIVAVPDLEALRVMFFEALSMLFGETAAVYGCNRLFRAMDFILVVGLWMVVLNYVDDYPHLEWERLWPKARAHAVGLMEALGWKVSLKPHKDLPFARVFVMLGVELDFSVVATAAKLKVANKPGRVQDVVTVLRKSAATKLLDPAAARSLAGSIVYSESQTFGRVGAPVLRLLREHAGGNRGPAVSADLAAAMVDFADALELAPSRSVPLDARADAVVIFMDGACDPPGDSPLGPSGTAYGAVMFDPRDGAIQFFGATVGVERAERWRAGREWQINTQAELLPAVAAKLTWKQRLTGRLLIFYIDSDPARAGLVKGYSPVKASAEIISASAMLDRTLGCFPWYARVVSESNIADAASRLDFAEVRRLFPSAVQVDMVQDARFL